MRTSVIAVAVLVICASAASAANTQLTVFSSNLSLEGDSVGSQWHGGFGLALSRSFTSRWSAELAVATQRHSSGYVLFVPEDGSGDFIPVTVRRGFRVYPVDLTARYLFSTSSRWTPYATAGLRYVGAPTHSHPAPTTYIPVGANTDVRGGFQFHGDRKSAELGLGTALRVAPHVTLRFDVIRLLRNDEEIYDPVTRTSFGAGWRF